MPKVKPKVVFNDQSEGVLIAIGKKDSPRVRRLGVRILGGVQKELVDGMVIELISKFDFADGSGSDFLGVSFKDNDLLEAYFCSALLYLISEGRAQQSGRERDVYRAQKYFEGQKVTVHFTRKGRIPPVERNPSRHFELLGVKKLKCDITGEDVTAETSVLLSPWDFEQFPKLRDELARYDKMGICPKAARMMLIISGRVGIVV